MKHLFIIIGIVFLSQSYSVAQEVSEKNWTLIHERFATWCPYCGTWGWDFKNQVLNEFKDDNVIFMALDYSGELTNSVAKEFDANFTGAGQPIFYVDGVNINVSSSNGTTKLIETRSEVDFKKNVLPYACVGIDARLDETSQSVTANAIVKFVQEVEGGDYYFGMYLLEDVNHSQASQQGTPLHKNVLVNNFLPNVFNNHLIYGKVDQGTEFKLSGTVGNVKAAKDKYHVLGVIWTKNNNKFLFHNAFISEVKSTTATSDVNNVNFTAYQAESGKIIVSLDKNFQLNPSSELILSDLSGKVIYQLSGSNLTTGKVQIDTRYTPGLHIVTLKNGSNQTTSSKKIMLF